MKKSASLILALGALAGALSAVETEIWTQSQREEFEKGTLSKLSLRSDGRLSLSPVFKEIFDPSAAYLWALAEDSKGVLYAGGGGPGTNTARLFRIGPDRQGKAVAELSGLEIHAIAIDPKDRVYAATSPDGKVYRVAKEGTAEVFYDPKAKYIWSMVFNRQGDLFIATGDQGEIHRVTPDGKGTIFFRTDETHARSMAMDANGNLIVGTEPGGLILRVSTAGEGFVLHQAAKREITAVAVAPNGAIYAAAVGSKPSAAPAPPAPAPLTPAASSGSITLGAANARTSAPPPTLVPTASANLGGSEVYRIDPTGQPTRVWNDGREIVYAIGFDQKGRPILGTGNRGNIYRLDTDLLFTQLVNSPPTQVTSFVSNGSGAIFAVTGNIGKVYQLGPEQEKEGTLESDVLDAGSFSDWGRISWQAEQHGGQVSLQSRSGNLDRPQKNWSPWAKVDPATGRTTSPAARFLQWKVTITASPNGDSPELTTIDTAYQPRNRAPVVAQIEVTPFNYRFPAQSLTLTPSTSITLPALGGKRSILTPTITSSSTSMPFSKGYIGARWLATDDNGDDLRFKVEIRGVAEKGWKLLKDDVLEPQFSWDSLSFPDGQYVLRVTATDAPDNPPARAMESQLVGEPLLIDNTPPVIAGLSASTQAGKLVVRWRAADARNPLERAEYSVNGSEWRVVEPTTGVTDSLEHEYSLTLDRPQGEVTVAVRIRDRFQNQSVASTVLH